MPEEIKNKVIEIVANKEEYQGNYLIYEKSFAGEYEICRTAMFDLNYWGIITIEDVEEIASAIDVKLSSMNLAEILLGA